jgi:pilus assembly protein CpaB
MRRRLIGIVAAVIMAGIGTFALVQYVRGAEDRALAGEQLVDVYIIDSAVPAGTPAEDLSARLRVEQVPVKLRAADGVTDLAGVSGLVTAVDLVPGEQLVLARMVRPEDVRALGTVSTPPGLVEVTVELTPTRALGGLLRPGDTVAVLSSFDPIDQGDAPQPATTGEDGIEPVVAPAAAGSGQAPSSTHLIVHKVLVTAVQKAATTIELSDATAIPEGNLLVTLAVTPADAERVVFTAEFGKLWLAAQGTDVPEDGTRIQTRASVYQTTPRNAQ